MRNRFRFLMMVTFFFVFMFGYKNTVFAAKVSGGTIKFGYGDASVSGFLDHRRAGFNKDIIEVCLYERSDKENGADTRELIIYSDYTASIYWTGTWCKAGSENGRCVDGEGTRQGIRNWSKNSSGYDEKYSEFDAYKWYAENNRCPAYLAQKTQGQSNWFFVSAGDSKKDYNKISNAAKKESGESYYSFYNAGEVSKTFSNGISCQYSKTEDGNNDIEIDFSKDGDANIKKINDLKYDSVNVVQGEINSRLTSSTYLKILEEDKCPKTLTSCLVARDKAWYEYVGMVVLRNLTPSTSLFFNLEDMFNKKIVIYGDSSIANDFCSDENQKYLHCIGDNCSEKDVCQAYNDFMEILEKDLDAYKSASKSDKKERLTVYNKDKAELKEYCSSALKHQNYAEGTCLSMCLELIGDLANKETAAGLRSPYSEVKCNIGEQVVNMIYNVLKWAKYIAPVLVIILSILDFIKALAAQNDDDMKKAQGRFVKRLIVAALLFLLPLIINFALKTFGFYNSGCDITDLF